MTFAARAASEAANSTGVRSAAPSAGSAAMAFGRTVMIGRPLFTFECTLTEPPKFA